MKKEKDKQERKKLSTNWKIGIITGVLLIGLIATVIIGGVVLEATVGEQEFQTSIVGMKYGLVRQFSAAQDFDYINLEESTLKTTSYSELNPNKWISNYATHSLDKYQWDFDPDQNGVAGSANIQINVRSEYYPTDSEGKIISDFKVTPVTIPMFDEIGNEWEITLYRTYIGTQFTLIVHGDDDINVFSPAIGSNEFIGQGSTAEVVAEYNCRETTTSGVTFGGDIPDFRFVLRGQIKEFTADGSTHSSPYSSSSNAFLFAKIAKVDISGIESTAGWQSKGICDGSFTEGQLVMYPTAKDALLGTSQLSDTDISQIELGDTLYDTIYTAFNYKVQLGADWNVNALEYAYVPLKIQAFAIQVDVFYAITTVYAQPVDPAGHTQYTTYTNPFIDPDLPEIDDLWNKIVNFFTNAWNTTWVRVIIYIAIGLVALALLYYLGIPIIKLLISLFRGMANFSRNVAARRAEKRGG